MRSANVPNDQKDQAGRPLAVTGMETALRSLVLYGAPPSQGQSQPFFQPGRTTVTCNGSGMASIKFRKPFPKSCEAVVFSSSHGSLGSYGSDKNGFNVYAGPPGATIYIDYMAFGY